MGIYNDSGSIGSISNSGAITGSIFGIYNYSGSIGSISNSGSVSGGSAGINNGSGSIGAISNSGSIIGSFAGIANGSGSIGSISNSGSITGYFGISNYSGSIGSISNSGSIISNSFGIYNGGSIGMISNSGTIVGSSFAIASSGSVAHIGSIMNSGLIYGNINVSGQDLTITGASGSGQGTLAGGEITLDYGSTLTFGPGNLLLADNIDPQLVINNGNLQLNTSQTITGDFLQNSTGNLIIGINSGSSGHLYLQAGGGGSGVASLAGGLQFLLGTNANVNGTSAFNYLSASSTTGAFTSITTDPLLKATVNLTDPTNPIVTFQANYMAAAASQNQAVVASGLQTAFATAPSAGGQSVLNSFNVMTVPQAQSAFSSVSGEGISAQQSTNFEATELAVDTARRQGTYWLMNECQTGASSKKNNALPTNALPMTCSSNDNREFRGWVAGVGGSNSMSGSSTVGSSSVSSQTGGGMAGFDYEVSPNLLVGMMAGATSSSYNVSNLSSSGSIASGQFGVYSVAKWQRFYLNTVFDYGYFSNASTRYVSGIGATSKETSSNNSNAFTGRAEVGYRVEHPVVNMMPFIAMQATSLQMGTYSESNTNGLGLNVQSKNVMSEPGSLGIQLDKAYDLDQEWSLYPLLRMAWVHEFQTTRTLTASLQSLPTGGWTVNGASAAANAANIGISLQAMNKDGFAFFASGNVVASPTTESYMGQVGFKLLW